MMLFRSAVKQICRRLGHHASFMCRPRLPNRAGHRLHLHQTLCDRRGGANECRAAEDGQFLRRSVRLPGGSSSMRRAAAAFTTPTINATSVIGPMRWRPTAPLGHDNRGVMVRALGGPGDAGPG